MARTEPADKQTPAAHGARPGSGVRAMPIMAMARFGRLMYYQGWDVDLARMCVDPEYACERLATAHTSSDERLRHHAMALFATYDRNRALHAHH